MEAQAQNACSAASIYKYVGSLRGSLNVPEHPDNKRAGLRRWCEALFCGSSVTWRARFKRVGGNNLNPKISLTLFLGVDDMQRVTWQDMVSANSGGEGNKRFDERIENWEWEIFQTEKPLWDFDIFFKNKKNLWNKGTNTFKSSAIEPTVGWHHSQLSKRK